MFAMFALGIVLLVLPVLAICFIVSIIKKTFIGQELDYFISMLYSVYIPAIGSNRANGIINKRGEIICLL